MYVSRQSPQISNRDVLSSLIHLIGHEMLCRTAGRRANSTAQIALEVNCILLLSGLENEAQEI